jgi:hypothetical protein
MHFIYNKFMKSYGVNGYIDDFRIYNRILTFDEIQNLARGVNLN